MLDPEDENAALVQHVGYYLQPTRRNIPKDLILH
jgi:hypothetical protein